MISGINIGKNISQYGKKCVKIATIISRSRLPDGWFRYSSSGLLSHTIIPPSKLAELLDHVKMKLIEHFKDYELATIKNHQYYDLSLVSCSYTDHMFILQIPICVKHYQQ